MPSTPDRPIDVLAATAPDPVLAEHMAVEQEQRTRGVGRSFLSLGAGEAVSRLIGFGGTVFVARALGAESYGVIAFAASALLYLTRIVDLGYDLGLGVRESAQQGRAVLRDLPGMLAGRVSVGLCVGLLTVAGALAFFPSPDRTVLALYAMSLVVTGFGTRWLHIGQERTGRVAIARLVGELATVSILLVVVRFPAHVMRVPIAQVAGEILTVGALLLWLRRDGFRWPGRIAMTRFRALLPNGLHMVASSLFGLAIFNADLVFLRFFQGPATVGYYAAAYTFVSFCLNIGLAFTVSLLSSLSKTSDASVRNPVYHRAHAHVFAITLPVAVGVWFVGPDLIGLVFGSAYGEASDILRFLIWSMPVAVLAETCIATALSAGGERLVLRLTICGAVLVLTLNALLIPRFGWHGAVISTFVAELMRFIVAALIAKHLGFAGVPLRRFWRPLVAVLGMALALYMIALPFALVIIVGALVYAALLFVTGGIRWQRGAMPELSV